MDIKQEIYLSSNSYFGKLTTTPSYAENLLMNKYAEPTIDAGGSIVDGTTSYSLTSVTKKIVTDSPIAQEFNPTTLGISVVECGARALAFVNVITDRIETEMDELKASDSTNFETTKWRIV